MPSMRARSDGEPPPGGPACPATAEADLNGGRAVAALYELHYRPLVQLAALLVSDLATAEDIVQESFAAVNGTRQALPDADAALCYLRRSVVHRARTAARPGTAARPTGASSADGRPEGDLLRQSAAVVTALRTLPVRQREVLVLQYFADLPETAIASATGLSVSDVRSQAARAMSSLHAALRSAGTQSAVSRPAASAGRPPSTGRVSAGLSRLASRGYRRT